MILFYIKKRGPRVQNYCITGNFRGIQFLLMVDHYHFAGLIFTDVHTPAHCVLDNRTYFMGLIFVVRRSSMKTMKIGPLSKFPAIQCYGIIRL